MGVSAHKIFVYANNNILNLLFESKIEAAKHLI
jgi:hypothetical protein